MITKVCELKTQIEKIQKECSHEAVLSQVDWNWDNYDLSGSGSGTIQYNNHCQLCEKKWRGKKHEN